MKGRCPVYARIAVLLGLLALEVFLLSGCATVQITPAVVKRVENGNNWLELHDTACTGTAGAFANMPADARQKLKGGVLLWEGKQYATCWLDYDEEHYLVFDELGDNGVVPKKGKTLGTES
jgi:hypothetical protein